MKSIGLKRDAKGSICQWYDFNFVKHITNQRSSYLVQELNSMKHFCMHSFLELCESGLCTWYTKYSVLFVFVFPLPKQNDLLCLEVYFSVFSLLDQLPKAM